MNTTMSAPTPTGHNVFHSLVNVQQVYKLHESVALYWGTCKYCHKYGKYKDIRQEICPATQLRR